MTTREAYVQQMEARLEAWNDEIARLRGRASHPALKQYLENLLVEVQAIRQKLDDLKHADDWEVIKVDVEQGVVVLVQDLDHARKGFEDGAAVGWDPEKARTREVDSEGWVEGMGHREHDSEGWAEGMGHEEPDSEGWAEGMGHQERESKGWPEGMDKR